MKLQAIIVEDEKLAQERLTGLLEPFKDKIDIIDYANNGQEAVEKINSLEPDLVFLDIQMPGKDGFAVLREIDESLQPVIIFTTAYDQYALEAFDNNTIDYLLKPISEKRIQKTMEKLDKFMAYKEEYSQNIQQLISYLNNTNPNKKMTKIKVHRNDEIVFLDLEDIIFIKASGKYTMARDDNREYLLNEPISYMEEHLPNNFVRVHRSFIINTKYLIKMKKWFTGKYKAVIGKTTKFEVPISRSYKDQLLNI
ncbi:MAG: response regulator transcription factor [Candidatus Marinimicrobia bacterium]|nr:response regulator transcription factor [Candidatus Neomarinimicrobiota bacterium]